MDTLNSNPEATESTPTAAPTPAASVPEVKTAPAAAPAPAPAPVVMGLVPTTSAKTVGGWNRFAGYDPKAAKDKAKNNNKPRDRR
jgi:hypothetical protein